MIRYVSAWFPMLLLAIANGALRQLTFGKTLSELRAHQLSTATGSALIGFVIWTVFRLWPPVSAGQAWATGAVWLALTVFFETAMGRFLQHRSWREIFRDYNLFAGRVWVLFLVWLALAPYVFYRLCYAV